MRAPAFSTISRRVHGRSGSESGFTLIELLVVLIILSILAAIAVAALFSQRDKASDADAKAAVRAAQTAAEVLRTSNDGNYDGPGGVTVANLRVVEPTLNDAPLSVPALAADSFTIRATSGTGNMFDIVRNADGTTALICAIPGEAGCPSDGTWD